MEELFKAPQLYSIEVLIDNIYIFKGENQNMILKEDAKSYMAVPPTPRVSQTATPPGSREEGSMGDSRKSSKSGSRKGSAKGSDKGSKKRTSKGSKKGSKKGTPKGSKKGTPKGSKKGTPKGSKKGTPKGSKKGTPKGSKKGTPKGSKKGTPKNSKNVTPKGSRPATPRKPTLTEGLPFTILEEEHRDKKGREMQKIERQSPLLPFRATFDVLAFKDVSINQVEFEDLPPESEDEQEDTTTTTTTTTTSTSSSSTTPASKSTEGSETSEEGPVNPEKLKEALEGLKSEESGSKKSKRSRASSKSSKKSSKGSSKGSKKGTPKKKGKKDKKKKGKMGKGKKDVGKKGGKKGKKGGKKGKKEKKDKKGKKKAKEKRSSDQSERRSSEKNKRRVTIGQETTIQDLPRTWSIASETTFKRGVSLLFSSCPEELIPQLLREPLRLRLERWDGEGAARHVGVANVRLHDKFKQVIMEKAHESKLWGEPKTMILEDDVDIRDIINTELGVIGVAEIYISLSCLGGMIVSKDTISDRGLYNYVSDPRLFTEFCFTPKTPDTRYTPVVTRLVPFFRHFTSQNIGEYMRKHQILGAIREAKREKEILRKKKKKEKFLEEKKKRQEKHREAKENPDENKILPTIEEENG